MADDDTQNTQPSAVPEDDDIVLGDAHQGTDNQDDAEADEQPNEDETETV